MSRKSTSTETLKLLYVHSGNECAFPDCNHPIFNDNGLYIAQLCHIKAANKGGERFDENQTDDERSSYENLLFMCHRHHKETDDISIYTVERLTQIKEKHESKYTEKGKEASKEMIRQILFDSDYFWNSQSKKTFDFHDMKIERDFSNDIFDLMDELNNIIQDIKDYCDICAESDDSKTLDSDLEKLLEKAGLDYSKITSVPYSENPFINRNWEMHNLGRRNCFSHLSLCFNQLKVKVMDELLKSDPENQKLKDLVCKFRKEFDENYDNSYYAD